MNVQKKNGEVWIFAEQENGKLSDIPFELLGKGRELADKLGVKLVATLLGHGFTDQPNELIASGADIVRLVDDESLGVYRTGPYVSVLESLVREGSPQILIFGATHIGRDLAPTLASRLRCGLTADCTDLQIGDYTDPATGELFKNILLQIRPAFGGNIIATIVNPRNWPQMATVREGVMKRPPPEISRVGQIIRNTAQMSLPDLSTEVLEIVPGKRKVNLKGARVIVAGGAGVGSRENFELLKELAAALGGAVGGSRAAVDLGYIDAERQIGQTGVTVRPVLYIACGISGAAQHIAGMTDSATILAINSDRNAPIFGIAHYGIIGDIKDVIPAILRAVRNNDKTRI